MTRLGKYLCLQGGAVIPGFGNTCACFHFLCRSCPPITASWGSGARRVSRLDSGEVHCEVHRSNVWGQDEKKHKLQKMWHYILINTAALNLNVYHDMKKCGIQWMFYRCSNPLVMCNKRNLTFGLKTTIYIVMDTINFMKKIKTC